MNNATIKKENNRYTGKDVSNWKVVNFEGKTLKGEVRSNTGEMVVRPLTGFSGYKAATFYAQKVGGVAVRE